MSRHFFLLVVLFLGLVLESLFLLSLLVSSFQPLPQLNIDRTRLGSLGLSAGAAMSVQFHVAHSSFISRVAAIAGAPYYCARGNQSRSLQTCRHVPEDVGVDRLAEYMREFVGKGWIDHTDNLKNARVWLFGGLKDSVRDANVVGKSMELYLKFLSESTHIEFVDHVPAQHGWPTGGVYTYGLDCGKLGAPHILKCEYDGSGRIVQFLFFENDPWSPPVNASALNLIPFSQQLYVPGQHDPSIYSLDDTGFVYVPTACNNRATMCKLTIVFHGCKQGIDTIDTIFMEHIGLNEWAEANNIVVLYPQVKSTELTDTGCWDWFGYTGANYATKLAPQIITARAMMDAIISTKTVSPKNPHGQ